MPTLDIALLHHPCAVPAEMAAVIIGPPGPPGEGIDIAALPPAEPLAGDEQIPLLQAGVLTHVTVDALRSAAGGAFAIANNLSELAADPAAQEAAQTNLGLGAADPLAHYILAKA